MKYRQERLSSLIQEELSKIISRHFDFSGCLVTITKVEIDEKLSRAVISFSVLSPCPVRNIISNGACSGCPAQHFEERAEGAPQDAKAVLKILERNCSYLQYLLVKKIQIKSMPKITFKINDGLEKAAGVEKILLEDKIKE